MAISMLSRTTREITLQVPNMVAPTNSVNSCLAFTLVTQRLMSPNIDQNNDCSVSNNLKERTQKEQLYNNTGTFQVLPKHTQGLDSTEMDESYHNIGNIWNIFRGKQWLNVSNLSQIYNNASINKPANKRLILFKLLRDNVLDIVFWTLPLKYFDPLPLQRAE